ncbi:MAG: hypothetical protein KGZ63_13340 [Clostridiales bacterium]|jgi:hypothetical protein|nr:hypothetical protein [Clostridiales bacterium]
MKKKIDNRNVDDGDRKGFVEKFTGTMEFADTTRNEAQQIVSDQDRKEFVQKLTGTVEFADEQNPTKQNIDNAVRKENVNRLRGTVEFIDPEKGPTHQSNKDARGRRRND